MLSFVYLVSVTTTTANNASYVRVRLVVWKEKEICARSFAQIGETGRFSGEIEASSGKPYSLAFLRIPDDIVHRESVILKRLV